MDENKDDAHTFALGSRTSQFRIIGNKLKTKKKLNYEVDGKEIEVVVRVSDNDDNVFSKKFIIKLSDKNDPPSLGETVFTASEEKGKDDLIAELQVVDEDTLTNKAWLSSRTPQEHAITLILGCLVITPRT